MGKSETEGKKNGSHILLLRARRDTGTDSPFVIGSQLIASFLSLSLLAPSLFTRTEIPRSKISSICREGIPTITIVSPSFKLKTSREDVVSLFFFFSFYLTDSKKRV